MNILKIGVCFFAIGWQSASGQLKLTIDANKLTPLNLSDVASKADYVSLEADSIKR
jgi:hypothetical protein